MLLYSILAHLCLHMSISVDHPFVQQILNDAVESRGGWTQGAPTNSIEALEAFIAAIQWKQPLFYALIISYSILLILALTIRHTATAQFLLLIICFLAVFVSEWLNDWLSVGDHWSTYLYLSDNYFDKGGIFISVLWSLPLAIIAFITLVTETIISRSIQHSNRQKQRLFVPYHTVSVCTFVCWSTNHHHHLCLLLLLFLVMSII